MDEYLCFENAIFCSSNVFCLQPVFVTDLFYFIIFNNALTIVNTHTEYS